MRHNPAIAWSVCALWAFGAALGGIVQHSVLLAVAGAIGTVSAVILALETA